MTIHTILKMGDPRLLRVAQPVTQFDTDELHLLIGDMFEAMRSVNGAGLAEQLAGFPQATMNADRMSAYQQWNLPLHHALHQEWLRGKACIAEGLEGAGRFADGQGRHGSFGR